MGWGPSPRAVCCFPRHVSSGLDQKWTARTYLLCRSCSPSWLLVCSSRFQSENAREVDGFVLHVSAPGGQDRGRMLRLSAQGDPPGWDGTALASLGLRLQLCHHSPAPFCLSPSRQTSLCEGAVSSCLVQGLSAAARTMLQHPEDRISRTAPCRLSPSGPGLGLQPLPSDP